jgi:AraC-like DNA-binding protein
MLTAKSESASHLKGYKLGADAYVSKPFDTSVLLTQIESVLKNRALLKERFSHDLDLKPEELSPSHSDEVFMQKAMGIIEMNMENPGFGVPQFVEGVGLGRTQVYNKTKALTGKTINEFILHIRMRRAAQLLKQSNKSITEIAISCGFNDQSYFSTSFKKYFSVSPSSFRSSSK